MQNINLQKLEQFMKRYCQISDNRGKQFTEKSKQDNFVRARASFDEIFNTIIQPIEKYLSDLSITDIFLETIGAEEKLLNAF